MDEESNRIHSFTSSRYQEQKDYFAKEGFYFDQKQEEIVCVHCGHLVRNLARDQDITALHEEIIPRCPNSIGNRSQVGSDYISRSTP